MPDASVLCSGCSLPTLAPVDLAKQRTARVEDLLRRNDPPLDSELTDFHLVVQQTPQILADFDEKISRACAAVTRLREARAQAVSHFEDAKALVHPHRKLPSEILGDIFKHCVPTWVGRIPSDSKVDSLNPHHPPWTLSQVCHRWRVIVTTSPCLWSHLVLHVPLHNAVSQRRLLYQLGLYIERSMRVDLTVILQGDKHGIEDSPMFPILELSTARWSKLSAVLPTTSLQAFSGNPFPRLRELHVTCIQGSKRDVTVDTFATLPNIQVLKAYGRDSTFDLVQLPWYRLEKYMCRADPVQSVGILQKMIHIRRLHVLLMKEVTIESPLRLPTLTALRLREIVLAAPLEKLTKHLHIPAVTELDLVFASFSHPMLHFPSFATPPVRLVKLTLMYPMNGYAQNTRYLLHFLRSLDQLEELTLWDSGVTTDFLSGLRITDHARILPRLQELDIGHCDLHDDEGKE